MFLYQIEAATSLEGALPTEVTKRVASTVVLVLSENYRVYPMHLHEVYISLVSVSSFFSSSIVTFLGLALTFFLSLSA